MGWLAADRNGPLTGTAVVLDDQKGLPMGFGGILDNGMGLVDTVSQRPQGFSHRDRLSNSGGWRNRGIPRAYPVGDHPLGYHNRGENTLHAHVDHLHRYFRVISFIQSNPSNMSISR